MSTETKRKNIFIRLYEIIYTLDFLCEKDVLERIIEIKNDEFIKAKKNFQNSISHSFSEEECGKFQRLFAMQERDFDYFPFTAKYRILQMLEIQATSELFTKLHNVFDDGKNSINSLDKCLDKGSTVHSTLAKYKDLIKKISKNRNKLIGHEDFIENIEFEMVMKATGYGKPFDKMPLHEIKADSVNKELHEFRYENRISFEEIRELLYDTLDVLEKEWEVIFNTTANVVNLYEDFITVLCEDL